MSSFPITGAPKQIVVAVAQGSTAAMMAFEELRGAIVNKDVKTVEK